MRIMIAANNDVGLHQLRRFSAHVMQSTLTGTKDQVLAETFEMLGYRLERFAPEVHPGRHN